MRHPWLCSYDQVPEVACLGCLHAPLCLTKKSYVTQSFIMELFSIFTLDFHELADFLAQLKKSLHYFSPTSPTQYCVVGHIGIFVTYIRKQLKLSVIQALGPDKINCLCYITHYMIQSQYFTTKSLLVFNTVW